MIGIGAIGTPGWVGGFRSHVFRVVWDERDPPAVLGYLLRKTNTFTACDEL